MILPSKELLSAVYGGATDPNERIDGININGNTVEIFYSEPEYGEDVEEINIYELAHKVKEWALKQGYRIASQLIERGITIDIGMNGFAVVHTCNREVNKEREDTEPEAVFAAGEWVLNQQDKGEV